KDAYLWSEIQQTMQRRLKRSRDGVRTRYCAVDAQPHGVQECGAGAGEGKDRIGDTADCGPVLREVSTQRPGEVVTFMALGLVIFVSGIFAQTRKSLTSSNDLKKLSVEELMSVEVTTVSRRESTVGESPAAVFVITPEDIRRSGATTFPELFRMVPGMDVARIDNNKWAISARGFNDRFNGKLLVQVDGRTVYNPLSSGVYWDAVDYPLEDIERIEGISLAAKPGGRISVRWLPRHSSSPTPRPKSPTPATCSPGGAISSAKIPVGRCKHIGTASSARATKVSRTCAGTPSTWIFSTSFRRSPGRRSYMASVTVTLTRSSGRAPATAGLEYRFRRLPIAARSSSAPLCKTSSRWWKTSSA